MILGIDIGKYGAIAALDTEKGAFLAVQDLPNVDGVTSAAGLLSVLADWKPIPDHAYVEQAQSMPKQGVSSTFKYGTSYGVVLGVLAALGIPYTLVRPAVWKKAYSLAGKDKEAARALAIQWFPEAPLHRKKDHGRAEALLIAQYGRERLITGRLELTVEGL